jgi:hypothetical protein
VIQKRTPFILTLFVYTQISKSEFHSKYINYTYVYSIHTERENEQIYGNEFSSFRKEEGIQSVQNRHFD